MPVTTLVRLIDAIPDIFFLIGLDGRAISANRAAQRQFGLKSDELLGFELISLLDNSEAELRDYLARCARSTSPILTPLKWRHNKENLQLKTFASRFESDSISQYGRMIALHCSWQAKGSSRFSLLNRELENNRRTLLKLLESKRLIEYEHERSVITLQSIADAVIATDRLGFIEVFNEAAVQLTQVSEDTAKSQHISEVLEVIEGPYNTEVQTPLETCLQSGESTLLHEVRVQVQHNEQEYVISASASPIKVESGRVVGAVMVFRDISDAHEIQQQIKYLAEHDLLTGIANRHQFNSALEHELKAANANRPCSMVFFDMDLFKVVNDTAGHQAGDQLLKDIVRIVRSRLRNTDLFARMGGDEFTVLLPNTSHEHAEALTLHIIQLVKRFVFRWDTHAFDITLSAGLATIDQPDTDPSEAIRRADLACYVAKRSGGNQLHSFSPDDFAGRSNLNEYNLLSEVRRALDRNDLTLNFQPLVDIRNDTIEYHEVLLRMRDSNKQPISPAEFIPVAERSGLMGDIDLWVVTHALRTIKAHQDRGESLKLSINLSGRSIGNRELLARIRELIAENQIPKLSVIFEITETAAIENIDTAIEFIEEIRALGCLFSLDDFGAGFSSFKYLRSLPVEFVKIDGSFIVNISEDSANEATVRAIHQIAQGFGKMTVAEYVENQEVVALLQEIGIDYAQGFYWGKPTLEPQLELKQAEVAKPKSAGTKSNDSQSAHSKTTGPGQKTTKV